MKTFLLTCFKSSENHQTDIDFLVTTVTPEKAKKILERRKAFLKLKESDSDALETYYWDYSFGNPISHVTADDLYPGEAVESADMGLPQEVPDTEVPDDLVINYEVPQMVVDEEGVRWTFTEKHDPEYVSTSVLLYNMIESVISGQEK